MKFKVFASTIMGMALIGFSLGLVLGMHLHEKTNNNLWAYLAVPLLGFGSAIAAYGTLSANKQKHDAEDDDG